MNTQQNPAIALLPSGNLWEDFLDTIGVSLETFCKDGPGGWMLGYIKALQLIGVRTVLILISARVDAPSRFTLASTNTKICVLPAPKAYRTIRHHMVNPNGYSVREIFGDVHGVRRLSLKVLKEVSPYLTTPLGLLGQEIQREGCSAILCQEYENPRFDACVLLGQLMRLPVFATFQGQNYQKGSIERYLRPLTLRVSEGLMIGAQTEIQRVSNRYNIPPNKLVQIFNPLDIKTWVASDRHEARASLGIPSNARVVVWHGRIDIEGKGLDILLEAWQQICRDRLGQELRLLLVGTGKDADKLHQRITVMQLQNVVWLNEYVLDQSLIRRYLSAADVYAFPSRGEGFPVAPLEAMACSLPVVAAEAQGIPDIFECGEASGGLLVPCNNAVALALALGRVLDNPTWGRELGQLARRRVEKFLSFEAVSKQLQDFLLSQKVIITKD
jgi:glycosyltransferase involved in cell wall biosynthesis